MDNDPHKPDQEEQDKKSSKNKEIKDPFDKNLENPSLDGNINTPYFGENKTLTFRSNWFSLNRASDPKLFNAYRDEAITQSQLLIDFIPDDSLDPNRWLAVGPRNINGRVKCIAVHPNNPNIIYAGAASGGLWRSFDKGRNWELFWEDNFPPSIGSIALKAIDEDDPVSPLEILVGTGEAVGTEISKIFHNFPGNGVYYHDGSSWEFIDYSGVASGVTIEYYTISKVLFSSISNFDFYVGGLDGFFGLKKNTVSGIWIWTSLIVPGIISDAAIDPNDSSIVYVCRDNINGNDITGSGIYKAIGGITFSKISYTIPALADAIPYYKWPKIAIGDTGNSDERIILLKLGNVNNSPLPNPIYETRENSTELTEISSPLCKLSGPNNDWSSCIAIRPGSNDTFIAGTIDLKLYTRNASGDWVCTSDPDVHDDHQMVAFSPSDPDVVYLANDGGVFLYDQVLTKWVKVSHGLQITQFYALGNWKDYGTAQGGGTQDQGSVATQGGLTWEFIDLQNNPTGRDGGYMLFDTKKPFNFFVERARVRPVLSSDGGDSFTTSSVKNCPNLPNTVNFEPPWLRVMSQIQTGSTEFFFTADHRIFRVERCANPPQWEAISEPLIVVDGEEDENGEFISAIGNSPSSPDIIYAGTGDLRLRINSRAQVYYFDQATTAICGDINNIWNPIIPIYIDIHQPITDIVVHPNDPDKIYVSFGWSYDPTQPPQGFVYKATKVGLSPPQYDWANITGSGTDFPTTSTNALAIDPDNPHLLFAGTDIGVFVLDSSGGNVVWQNAGIGLPISIITDLRIDTRTRSLFAASFGRGMYRLYLDGIANERVYLRSNILDTGEDMKIPTNAYDPLLNNKKVRPWQSPDIKILNLTKVNDLIAQLGSISNLDGIEFDDLVESIIGPLGSFHILVQAHNRGWDTATNVRVGLFYRKKNGPLPNGYSDLSSPTSDDRWEQIGTAQTIPVLEANKPKILSWAWSNTSSFYAARHDFFAIIDGNLDPYTNPSRSPHILTRFERKAAWKKRRLFKLGPVNSTLYHFYDIALSDDESKEEDRYEIDIEIEDYRKGRMGLLLPDKLFDRVIKENPDLRQVNLGIDEFHENWLTQIEDNYRDEILDTLQIIDTSRLIEFPGRPSLTIKNLVLDKDETFRGVFWGDYKTKSLSSLEFILRRKAEIVDGETFTNGSIPSRLLKKGQFVQIRISLLKVEILQNFDHWIYQRERFAFFSRVSFNNNPNREVTRRFSKRLGFQVSSFRKEKVIEINQVLFEGFLKSTDSMTLSLLGVEKDLFSPDDKLTTYKKNFTGNIQEWVGLYTPNDEKEDLEHMKDWSLWYRIEFV